MYTANAASCTTVSTGSATGGTTSTQPLLGIIGFESNSVTTVYAVNDQGYVFSWTPGSAPAFKTRRSSTDPYNDIHGLTPSRLFLAATDNPGAHAQIDAYDADANNRVVHNLNGLPNANNGSVLGVWAWDSTHAYAVGKQGNLLWWDGGTNWYFINPTASMQVDLNSVAAPDGSSAYIASQDGKIRRPTISGWVEHFTASGPLKDIAASSRQDVWAVGNGGIVVHFPEP
jgi:hypothetical protein